MKFLYCSALMVIFSCACLGDNVLGLQGELEVFPSYILFGESLTGPLFAFAPGYGEFQVTNVSSGSIFATGGVTSGELGKIQSLTLGTGFFNPPYAFIVFDADGSSLPLTATNIRDGNVGPFDLQDTSQGALATFEILGYIGSNPAQDPFTAEFSIGFPGFKVEQLFSQPIIEPFCGVVATSGAPEACNPFPSVSTTIPEPSYVLMVAAGLLAAAVAVKRRQARKRVRSC